ncbi:MAG TPA: hypothetical protein VFA45_17425 [Actinomycetes bacterium]|nr:hypothetical protein [Actinomycetes bacterium]
MGTPEAAREFLLEHDFSGVGEVTGTISPTSTRSQLPVGVAVTPARWTRRVSSSMKNRA